MLRYSKNISCPLTTFGAKRGKITVCSGLVFGNQQYGVVYTGRGGGLQVKEESGRELGKSRLERNLNAMVKGLVLTLQKWEVTEK